MAARKKISKKVETEVLFRCKERCCLCHHYSGDLGRKKGQIAHIDQDRNNNQVANLAFLCLEHHDEYDSQTSQSKGITDQVLIAAQADLLAWIDEGGALVRSDELKFDDSHLQATIGTLLQSNMDQGARLQALSEKLGISSAAVESFFATLGRRNVPLEQWPRVFPEIAEAYLSLKVRLESITGKSEEIKRIKRDIHDAIESGDSAKAEELLVECEELELQAISKADDDIRNRKRDAAETLAIRGDNAITLLEYPAAAGHYGRAAELCAGHDEESEISFLEKQADALYRHGDEFGDNRAIEDAIGAYQVLTRRLPRDHAPLDWARIQNDLGIALSSIGERESGTERLEAAVDAYRDALTERTRERVPLAWAMTQNNLGTALASIGERESGTERLEAAVDAFCAALTEWTQERVPLDWAMTQNNLGNTLRAMGERESGMERLEAAVDAFRASLTERTRERVPLDWAMTQNNLGNALTSMGERESGTERLEAAVGAFRAALSERTRDRVPLSWAMTQNNLGTALRHLGERLSDAVRLKAAVEAYRAASSVFETAGADHYVGLVAGNLATAEQLLAERRGEDGAA